MRVVKLKSVDSTHLYALRLIESDHFFLKEKEIAIVAEEQTNGIGRCNRRWISKKGNLFTSIILRNPPVDFGQISLTIACAVRETIAQYVLDQKNLVLHWPNDVYFQNKKISGILLAVSQGFLIISIGINVNSSLSEIILKKNINKRAAISLCEINKRSDKELQPDKVLCILLDEVEEWISLLVNLGFSKIRSYWLRNMIDINRSVTIRNGKDELNGIFLGIDGYGKAILKKGNKRVLISSGDLFNDQDRIGYSCE